MRIPSVARTLGATALCSFRAAATVPPHSFRVMSA